MKKCSCVRLLWMWWVYRRKALTVSRLNDFIGSRDAQSLSPCLVNRRFLLALFVVSQECSLFQLPANTAVNQWSCSETCSHTVQTQMTFSLILWGEIFEMQTSRVWSSLWCCMFIRRFPEKVWARALRLLSCGTLSTLLGFLSFRGQACISPTLITLRQGHYSE